MRLRPDGKARLRTAVRARLPAEGAARPPGAPSAPRVRARAAEGVVVPDRGVGPPLRVLPVPRRGSGGRDRMGVLADRGPRDLHGGVPPARAPRDVRPTAAA